MAADFKALLSKGADTVERPPLLPDGTYYGNIKSHQFGESREKKTPFVEFTFQVTGPGEDIADQDFSKIDFSKKTMRQQYYLTDDAMYRLRELMEGLGMNIAGRSFGELIPEMQNMGVLLAVATQAGNDGNNFNVLNKVSAAG